MNLQGIERIFNRVPQTYGEAVKKFPWIRLTDCKGHEWDNRTTMENTAWLIDQMNKMIVSQIV